MSEVEFKKGDYVDVVIKCAKLSFIDDDGEFRFSDDTEHTVGYVYPGGRGVTVTKVRRPLPTTPGSVIVADQKHATLAGDGNWYYVGNTRGPSGPELDNATVLFDAGEGK